MNKLKQRIKEKWGEAGFQRYFRNTGWMFGAKVLTLTTSLFVSVYMARTLGPENFGTLNFIISFVSISGFTLFAVDSLIIKKINNNTDRIENVIGSSFLIKIINSIFTITASTLVALYFSNTPTTTLLVFMFSTFTIFQSFSVVDFYFQANAKNKPVSIMNMVSGVISSLIKIYIIYLGLPIVYIIVSYVFDQVINALGYTYLYKKYVGNIFQWKFDKNIFNYLIIKSWPFTLSAIAANIYIRADQVFLKLLLGSEAVGLYVVAVRFSEVWFFIYGTICASLLPAILNSQRQDINLFLSRSKKLYSLLFYTSLSISIAMFILAPIIIHTLYGNQYEGSILILRIYIWSIIGVFVSAALQQLLLAQDKFKTILYLNFISMIISLVLNYLFIPVWGLVGAAVANIFAYTVPIIFILSMRSMRDQRKAFLNGIFRPFSRT